MVMVSRRNSSVVLSFEGNSCSSQALFSKLGAVSKKRLRYWFVQILGGEKACNMQFEETFLFWSFVF